MMRLISFIILFLITSLPLNAQNQVSDGIDWSNTLKYESADKQFQVKFGGQIMHDVAFFLQDDSLENAFGELTNGVEFRRVRIYNSGTIYNNIKYKLQLDFAGGNVVFKDVYINLTKIPVIGNFIVGHFKEPLRLETLTSSKYITFMERSFIHDFSTERNTGFMMFNHLLESRLAWQLGLFRNADPPGNDKNAGNGYNITGRLSGTPVNNPDIQHLLHLGIAYSYKSPDDNEYMIRSQPESHLAPYYVSTGSITDVRNINILGTEAALVLGALSLQGEFLHMGIHTKTPTVNDSFAFYGFYSQISYFITGESRKYIDFSEGFGRINPQNNFGDGEGGTGALEVALRFSGTNLNSHTITGGRIHDLTAGLNWYLNPNTRFMFNYIFANIADTYISNILQMRFQVEF